MLSDAGKQGLQQALDEAVAERDRLDVVIAYLGEMLGVDTAAIAWHPASPGSGRPITPRVDTSTGQVDLLSLVAEGEFYGQSMASAASAVLRKIGKPNALKTAQLVEALRKGGVPVKSGGTLYRSINRNSKFRRVGKGLWGLSEWYPASRGQSEGSLGPAFEPLHADVRQPKLRSQEGPETEKPPDEDA